MHLVILYYIYLIGLRWKWGDSMINLLNKILSILKILLLLVCFVFTFYIIINMYRRLNKDLLASIINFIPFFLLFILFSVNFIFKQDSVNNNLFYNIVCNLAFGMLGFCIFRTLCDKNMIIILRQGYDINFNYFADIIAPMKFILYGLSFSNILLMLDGSKFINKNSVNKDVKSKR